MNQNSQSIRLGFPSQVGKQLRCYFRYGVHSDHPNSWFLFLTTAVRPPSACWSTLSVSPLQPHIVLQLLCLAQLWEQLDWDFLRCKGFALFFPPRSRECSWQGSQRRVDHLTDSSFLLIKHIYLLWAKIPERPW